MCNWYDDAPWRDNKDYHRYLKNHYPEAIEFVKTESKVFKKKRNVWLDIIHYDTFLDIAPDGSRLLNVNKILFKKIEFDVFPRKIQPKYIKKTKEDDREVDDYNRYITWKTATDDIENQRGKGYQGERWIVECRLDLSKTKDKTKIVHHNESIKKVANPNFDIEYKEWLVEMKSYDEIYKPYLININKPQKFVLPNGHIKQVFLRTNQEKKFQELRKLGVKESDIQECKNKLKMPSVQKPTMPSHWIVKIIPAHDENRVIKGKWVWHHEIKNVSKKDVKKNN